MIQISAVKIANRAAEALKKLPLYSDPNVVIEVDHFNNAVWQEALQLTWQLRDEFRENKIDVQDFYSLFFPERN